MATYTRLNPATLAAFAAVIDDPTDAEAANKLAQVDLQTRRFVYDYLITKFDVTTGKLLPAAVDAATTLAGLTSGSTSNSGTQRQVVQGTISTPDLRDDAVATAKIINDAVTTAKITDLNVTTDKINNLAVTAAKIADTTITQGKLANASVGTAQLIALNVTTATINDLAVTTGKLADNAVTGAKMVLGSAEGQLLIAGANPYVFAVKSITGDATLSKEGVLTLASTGQVGVEEQASLNTAAGSAAAVTWNVRGVTRAWVKTFDSLTSTFLTISTEKLLLSAGTYIITATSPAYAVAGHQLRVQRFNSGNTSQEIVFGTSETCPASTQTRASVRAKMTFVTGDYFKLEHYTVTAVATNGLGLPTNATASGAEVILEVYAQIHIQKIG